jgi:plasmid stabilization system protein ParE
MNVSIRAEAERDLEQAFDHYERERLGLGHEFLDEYVAGTRKIAEAPLRWPPDPSADDCHRYRLDRFPYAIVYRIESNRCMIFAVAHLHRKPDYWLGRLEL